MTLREKRLAYWINYRNVTVPAKIAANDAVIAALRNETDFDTNLALQAEVSSREASTAKYHAAQSEVDEVILALTP